MDIFMHKCFSKSETIFNSFYIFQNNFTYMIYQLLDWYFDWYFEMSIYSRKYTLSFYGVSGILGYVENNIKSLLHEFTILRNRKNYKLMQKVE